MELWILNLVVHHVALDKSWLETADAAKDWGNALLSEDWKVPPPLWARHREDKWMLEDKNKENTGESLESLPTSRWVSGGAQRRRRRVSDPPLMWE